MRVFTHPSQLEHAIGDELGVSSWYTITQAQIDAFADATDDHEWIHVDPVRAAEGPFRRTIAHGFLVLSHTWVLAADIFQVQGTSISLNYGVDSARFVSIVPVDSRIRLSARLASVDRRGEGRFRVSIDAEIQVEGRSEPACVLTALLLYVAEDRRD